MMTRGTRCFCILDDGSVGPRARMGREGSHRPGPSKLEFPQTEAPFKASGDLVGDGNLTAKTREVNVTVPMPAAGT